MSNDVPTKGHSMNVITSSLPLLDSLNSEWNEQLSAATYDFGSLGSMIGRQALNLVQQKQDTVQRDVILLELLELEAAGHPVAGRVILQSFLPLVVGYARTSAATRNLWRHSRSDAIATTISAAWEVITVFLDEVGPSHRRNIAGRIRSNLIKTLSCFASHVGTEYNVACDFLEDLGNADPTNELGIIHDDPAQELITLFTWAIDHGVLARDEIHLLVRIELSECDPGDARNDAAHDLGITRESLNRRVHRIRTKLMTAVCGDVQTKVKYAPRRKA